MSKNILCLPWILKLIGDMGNDSTPLNTELSPYHESCTYIPYIKFLRHLSSLTSCSRLVGSEILLPAFPCLLRIVGIGVFPVISNQCFGSVSFWCGSGSADPFPGWWIRIQVRFWIRIRIQIRIRPKIEQIPIFFFLIFLYKV